MKNIERITHNSLQMGGKPCIRNQRITVGLIVGLIAKGYSHKRILQMYPYLEKDDIQAALSYGAWGSEEIELPLAK